MEIITLVLRIALILFLYIVFIRILMEIANFVGKFLGLGRLFTHLFEKIQKK